MCGNKFMQNFLLKRRKRIHSHLDQQSKHFGVIVNIFIFIFSFLMVLLVPQLQSILLWFFFSMPLHTRVEMCVLVWVSVQACVLWWWFVMVILIVSLSVSTNPREPFKIWKCSFSPDIIPWGWLGSKHQQSNPHSLTVTHTNTHTHTPPSSELILFKWILFKYH